MSQHPGKDECMHLIALSNRMGKVFEAPSTKNDPAFLDGWRKRADALLKNPNLESLEGEQLLENLSLDLRQRWLHQVYLRSASYMMSPPHRQRKLLPGDVPVSYPYDRWIKPQDLEQRLDTQSPPPENWQSETRVFSSGMSAITLFLQIFRAFGHDIFKLPPRSLQMHWFGGYFEISKALHVLCDKRFQGRKHGDQKKLCAAVTAGLADLILIEPVAANIQLDVFDMDGFVQACIDRPHGQPCVIVFDTSLVGDTFPLERFCRMLKDNPPSLVVNIRSGLKLDQQGLELSNLGLMTLWCPDFEDHRLHLKQIANNLQVSRATFGSGLSQDEYAVLSASFILDRMLFANYCQAVFDNNQRLALALDLVSKSTGSLIGQVIHPALGQDHDKPWAVSPYVNIHYQSDDHTDRDVLRTVLEFEIHARNLCLVLGNSFGFRGHRFEMGFVPDLKYSSLRIAMGARSGPSVDGIIALFEHLAAFKDFAALRAAYPDIATRAPTDQIAEET
ncbi:MAG: hypothetical protein JKY17_07120 [Magnetovibrio sp.]|nr:hypothetical protein [Magnetovibrio sp.]